MYASAPMSPVANFHPKAQKLPSAVRVPKKPCSRGLFSLGDLLCLLLFIIA